MLFRLTFLMGLAALPARAELHVVTDIAPVQSLVAQVAGDSASAVALLPPGASAHHYALRPSEARLLAAADLLVTVGPALTPWLDEAAASLAPGTPHLALLEVPGTVTREGHDHDDQAHDEGHGSTDPHAWLAPENAATWLPAIAKALARLDPPQAATYRDNAAAAAEALQGTSDTIAARLAPVAAIPLLLQHDSLGYFADSFGLTLAGALSDSDDAPPAAAHLAAIRETIAAQHVPCLFTEAAEPAPQARAIARDTGIALAELDPLGARLDPGPGLYPALLTALADDIATCLAQR